MQRLRTALACMGRFSRTFAVFAMLRDKDIAGVARELAPLIDRWVLAPLAGPRGATVTDLQAALSGAGVVAVREALGSVAQAYARAREQAAVDDRIIVFGSFHTVGELLIALEAQPRA